MAKIRGIKPDLWTDEDFVELSPFARLLWLGLWNFSCDNGHIQDKSKQIKMRVLPTDDVNCAELLREIEAQGLIERADGWITTPNLTHHQKPHKRWWVTCEKPGCEMPEGASYGYVKRDSPVAQPLNNGGTTVNNGGSTADVDVDGDVELMVKVAKPRKRALPDDWKPNPAALTFAAEKRIDVEREAFKFRNHAASNGRTLIDWDRAFLNWLDKSTDFAPRGGRPVTDSRPEGW